MSLRALIAGAARQEVDGIAAHAQTDLSRSSVPANRGGDCAHQFRLARLRAVLCGGALKSMLLVRARLGGEEDSAPPCPVRGEHHGLGWKRWSRGWLYGRLGLFDEYRGTC
jgi:hypothetical protein